MVLREQKDYYTCFFANKLSSLLGKIISSNTLKLSHP
jgi:hypothetical protein